MCEEDAGSCVGDALPAEQQAASPTGPLDVQFELWKRALVLLEGAPEGRLKLRFDQEDRVLKLNHSSLGTVLRVALNSIGQILKIDRNPRWGRRVPNDDSPLALILSRSELELVEKVLDESLDRPVIMEELEERRDADERGRKLAREGKLRDAARVMGWLLPKGRRTSAHDREAVVWGYWNLTNQNTDKARRYFEKTHQLTKTEAQERVPEAPLHPWNALELMTKLHFLSTDACRGFLIRAKRDREKERRKPDGDPATCALPDIRIPSSTKPKNLR